MIQMNDIFVLPIQNSTDVCLIDLEFSNQLIKYKWWQHKTKKYIYGYLPDQIKRNQMLSRFILNYDGKKEVDHINRNRLDNRRINLKLKTASANCHNRNGNTYRGVYQDGDNFR